MRRAEITRGIVAKAVAIYLDLAYGGGQQRRVPVLELPEDAQPDAVLGQFQREKVEDPAGQSCTRYTMRLGNRNYPFMKLLLQEHLVAGEFYFGVDTHDQMDIRPDFPDYEAWMAVRRFNGNLRKRIEAQFVAEGLPTAATICEIARRRSQRNEPATGARILVIDDEEQIATAVETLLRAQGYRVSKAFDGQRGLALAREQHPDLVVLDYELPEMDGLEVIAALRHEPRTRGIPVLLTTASRITLDDIRRADGFLAKPFQEELLYQVVRRLLTAEKGGRLA
jgi:CheY-like chemotaxis protein